jgi:E3 ubiquitin-protein ligase HERC3
MLEVHAGGAHACTLDAAGSVRCWGAGARGQLGLGDSENRAEPDGAEAGVVDLGGPAVALATGGSHTCAILSRPGRVPGRAVKCWGDNGAGQLGLGDREPRGDGPFEMGLHLPEVELGSDWGPVALALGSRHSCALFAHGGVKCWGENGLAQLGLSDTSSRGGGSEDMGKNLPFIDFGGDSPAAIAAGANLTCAAFASGVAKCWGQSLAATLDPLADVTPLGNALPVAISDGPFELSAGNRHACALTADGNVLCWGSFNAGQIGSLNAKGTLHLVDLGPRGASSISAGAEHTCAMVDGRLKCWGLNVFGELGVPEKAPAGSANPDGSESAAGLPFLDLGTYRGAPAVVTDVSLGVHFSCAVIEHRNVECWGANHSGQLGYQP